MSGKVKRLSESERLEVISKLNQPNPPSKRSITQQYGMVRLLLEKSGRSVKIFVRVLL